MEKTYVRVSEGTVWLEDIIKNNPQVLDSDMILIHRQMNGDLVYMVDTEIMLGNAVLDQMEQEHLFM